MPITPWYVGQTRPAWSIQQFQDAPASGGPASPLNITGSTITLHYKLADASGNPSGPDILGVNSGAITDGLNGKFTYTPAASDTFVTAAGIYIMQWKFDYGSGAIVWSDPFVMQTQATD